MYKQLIDHAPSTNTLLSEMIADGRLDNIISEHAAERNLFTLYTYNQTAGRGQAGNKWESEPNKNLTFSTLFELNNVAVENQFVLCQVVPLAVKNVLNRIIKSRCADVPEVVVKWPNDIYWCDKKLGGILIEHSIMDGMITNSIAGVGLNINQRMFRSDAPNPVSLVQITGFESDPEQVLDAVLSEFEHLEPLMNQPDRLKSLYLNHLYRADDYYSYRADNEVFDAKIVDVAANGLLTLMLRSGEKRQYAFKQVSYII